AQESDGLCSYGLSADGRGERGDRGEALMATRKTKGAAVEAEVAFRNRIVEMRHVRPSELIANPSNFRGHDSDQRELLRAIARDVGIVGAVIARQTAAGLELLDGHMRAEEFAELDSIPVIVVDLNDEEAKKILATFDPISALADIDIESRADLT